MTELAPCPFCGGSFEITKTIHETYYLSHEPNRLCIVPRSQEYFSEKAAMEAVNRRPWIPVSVSERKPEYDEIVLVTTEFNAVDMVVYRKGFKTFAGVVVTHWIPLPKPAAPQFDGGM